MNKVRNILVVSAIFVCGTLFGATTLNAQNLPNDRALWNSESAYAIAVISGDPEKIAAFWHDDYLGWLDGDDLPWDKQYGKKAVRAWFHPNDAELSNHMLEPLTARVIGDTAVTHYRLEYTAQNTQGEKSTRRVRLSHFWLKTGDGWKIFGSAGTAE